MKYLGAFVLGLAALAPQAANAQAASRDGKGSRYCSMKGVYLGETKDGLQATIYVWHSADVARITYPGGPLPWLSTDAEAYIEVGYGIPFDRAGKPTARPKPVQIKVTAGELAAGAKRPLLTMRIKAGEVLTPPIIINPYNPISEAISVDLTTEGGADPEDVQMPQANLYELASAIEQGPSVIILSEGAKEIARIPVPRYTNDSERTAAFGWLQKTAPLLAAGKCG